MKAPLIFILSLLVVSLLASCSKSEPQSLVTFSYDGAQLSYAFQMTGQVVNLPSEDRESGIQKIRFMVEEGEWVEFAIHEEEKFLDYQAHFPNAPNYRMNFEAAAGHNFWQGDDPEQQSIWKAINAARQGGRLFWR